MKKFDALHNELCAALIPMTFIKGRPVGKPPHFIKSIHIDFDANGLLIGYDMEKVLVCEQKS